MLKIYTLSASADPIPTKDPSKGLQCCRKSWNEYRNRPIILTKCIQGAARTRWLHTASILGHCSAFPMR